MSTDGFTRRCALYRHYDEDKVLLYVGISENPMDRTLGHARSSEWVRYAFSATAEWFDSREEASAEEKRAVETETPIFNRQYALGDVDARIQEYTDWRYSQEPGELLSSYEIAVHTFLALLPDELREAADQAVRERRMASGRRLGQEHEANVLDEVGRMLWPVDADTEPPF
jgi:hypothetical protein